jgi:hypothetical protein
MQIPTPPNQIQLMMEAHISMLQGLQMQVAQVLAQAVALQGVFTAQPATIVTFPTKRNETGKNFISV